MVALEEWLQQKYVEYYDETEKYPSKPELLNAKIEDLLLKDGSRNYIINNNKVYYLINKSDLPKEIKEQLVGGDATDYTLYTRLIDVYGMTEDLKVYYCNTETGVSYGDLDVKDVDLNQPVKSVNENPDVKDMIEDVLGNMGVEIDTEVGVTTENLYTIKDLSLDGAKYKNINDLSVLSEMKNLETLILSTWTLSDLNGLEGCPLLNSVYLKNCNISDYTNLEKVINLQKLYFYFPTSMTEEIANEQVENLGDGLENAGKLSKLEYFGISGVTDYFEGTRNYTWDYHGSYDKHKYTNSTRSKLKVIDNLSKFNETIKNNLSYIYLQCNNINSVKCFSGFGDIVEITLNCNSSLTSLFGLENHSSIFYIAAHSCNLKTVENLSGDTSLQILTVQNNPLLTNFSGIEDNTQLTRLLASNCNITDISALSKHNEKFINLEMENNVNLQNVITLGRCKKLVELYLNGNINMEGEQLRDALANSETHILKNCGRNYSLPGKYLIYFSSVSNSIDYSYNNLKEYLTDSSDDFLALKNQTQITRLSLKGQNKLSDLKINEILSTLPNLEFISLYGCTALASLDFVKGVNNAGLTKIKELDLRYSGINGSALNILDSGYSRNICTLAVSCTNIDLVNMQKTINALGNATTDVMDDSWIGTKSYEARGLIVDSISTVNEPVLLNFGDCDEKVLENFQSSSNENKGVIFDFSKLDKMKKIVVRKGTNDVVVSKSCGYLYIDALDGLITDFSKCNSVSELSIYYQKKWTSVVKNSIKPVEIKKELGIYRTSVTLDELKRFI